MTAFLILLALFGAASGYATINAERNAPPVGEFVSVEGEKLHLLERGGDHKGVRPSIVLIHGASVNLRDMDIALGERLAQRYHVLMIDRPGRGYSSRPAKGWALDSQARLIKAAIDARGLNDPIIVGQSLGGAVALSYALQYQDEMRGLVLLAAVSHEWPGGVAWYNSASATPVVGFLLRRLVIPIYGQFIGPESVASSFAPDEAPANYFSRAGVPLLFRPKEFRNNAADIVNLKDEIIRQQDRYGVLNLPVAIVTGLQDTTVSPDIHSRALARDVDGASLTLLEDTGHALHHAEPARIIAIIDALADDAAAPSAQASGE
ncbi:MAG: alpha/beta hydrolase [Pseudomonadota bacterium]